MNWIRRIRSYSRPGALALAALVLLGALLGGFHHHDSGRVDDGCAVCTLAHTTAATPDIVVLPPRIARTVERVSIAAILAPACEPRTAASSRAPPQG
jgi:hypothetical protein